MLFYLKFKLILLIKISQGVILMLFYGERKVGCRFLEVYLHGYRTLLLENNCIRATLLVDKGVDIISFIHKPTDQEFVWTNPMGLSCLEKRRTTIMDTDCYSDNYLGGMFEILPNFGEACSYRNMHFPQHSEVSFLPWDMQVILDSPEIIKLKFKTKLSKYPFIVEKELTLRENSASLCFEESIYNSSEESLPFLWAFHPCVGFPFLNDDCIFELPFAPNKPMPRINSNENYFEIFDSGENNFAAIHNKKTGTGIAFSWDSFSFPHCALWINAGATLGHHRLGGAYVASILPCNSSVLGLTTASKSNKAPILKPGATVSGWYNISSFSMNKELTGVTKEGDVF